MRGRKEFACRRRNSEKKGRKKAKEKEERK